MELNFDTMEETALAHFNGGEGTVFARMFRDDTVRIMRAALPAGASIGLHTHTDSVEVLYVLSGTGTVITDGGEPVAVTAGMCHYCEKGHGHTLINNAGEPLVIFVVVPKV